MGITLTKPSKPAATPAPAAAGPAATPAKASAAKATAAAPAASKAAAGAAKPWYFRGADIETEVAKEERRMEERANSMWRWFIKPGETGRLTFVDGKLTDKGVLEGFMYREHRIQIAGKWEDFVCTIEQEPCPIHEMGDDASLVTALTVIDHREFAGKKGIHKDRPKLFVFKAGTRKVLQKYAATRGGLAGWTVEVSRTEGDKVPNVGDVFDFIEKTDDAVLRTRYTREVPDPKNKDKKIKATIFVPADYQNVIRYVPATELRKLGLGKGTPIGGEGPVGAAPASEDVTQAMG